MHVQDVLNRCMHLAGESAIIKAEEEAFAEAHPGAVKSELAAGDVKAEPAAGDVKAEPGANVATAAVKTDTAPDGGAATELAPAADAPPAADLAAGDAAKSEADKALADDKEPSLEDVLKAAGARTSGAPAKGNPRANGREGGGGGRNQRQNDVTRAGEVTALTALSGKLTSPACCTS